MVWAIGEGMVIMKMERLTLNKIKVFISSDDLLERGLSKEDIWKNIPEVQTLFRDVIQEASKELGFMVGGRLSVQILSLQAQGVVIIVSQDEPAREVDEEIINEFVEMRVTLDECLEILFEFECFEDVVQVSLPLYKMGVSVGKIISFDNKFYVHISPDEISEMDYDMIIAILSEYGYPAVRTIHRIETYGKTLFSENGIKQMVAYFHPNELEEEIQLVCKVTLSTETPKQNSILGLTAIVTDANGKALENVDISVLVRYKTSERIYFGLSDQNGRANIPIKIGRVKPDFTVKGSVSFYYKHACQELEFSFTPKKA